MIKGSFFNAVYDSSTGTYDREYNAEDLTSYLSLIVGGGVFPTPSTQLQVLAASGMTVNVDAGSGWFPDGHKIENTSLYSVEAVGSDISYTRIDRVVMYCDNVNRRVGLDVVTGVASADPVAPDLVRTEDKYELGLATITIPAGAVNITQDMITDTRADSSVCGWVAGLIQQIDTESLFLQWQTAYEEYFQEQQDRFEEWLHDLTEELNVDTYVNAYTKTQEVPVSGTSEQLRVYLIWAGYEYEVSDIVNVYFNGIKVRQGSEYQFMQDTLSGNYFVKVSIPSSQSPQVMTEEVTVEVIKSVIGFDTTP